MTVLLTTEEDLASATASAGELVSDEFFTHVPSFYRCIAPTIRIQRVLLSVKASQEGFFPGGILSHTLQYGMRFVIGEIVIRCELAIVI